MSRTVDTNLKIYLFKAFIFAFWKDVFTFYGSLCIGKEEDFPWLKFETGKSMQIIKCDGKKYNDNKNYI